MSAPCPYFSQSKDTLLVCRRGFKPLGAPNGRIEWKKVEMRHQRTSDVYQACHVVERTTAKDDGSSSSSLTLPRKPHAYVQKMVETMLPEARYDASDAANRPGRLLEIWAKPGATRSGWVSVVGE